MGKWVRGGKKDGRQKWEITEKTEGRLWLVGSLAAAQTDLNVSCIDQQTNCIHRIIINELKKNRISFLIGLSLNWYFCLVSQWRCVLSHTPIACDEVSHVLLQFKQHHTVSGVTVEGVDDKLVQVYAGGVGVLHAELWADAAVQDVLWDNKNKNTDSTWQY